MTTAGATLADADLMVDRELAEVATSFRFLLDVSPTNAPEAREHFRSTGRTPELAYRALEDDPALTCRRLAAIPVHAVEDPTLASLLHAKRDELTLLLQMLESRGAPDFLGLSIEAFGTVTPHLLAEAEAILAQVPPPEPDPGPWLTAEAFAARARTELDRYRAEVPDLEAHVEVRPGSTGVMVSNGDLLVAPDAQVSEGRVEALLSHEIGTHVVTFVNGAHQPVHCLASGLAGFEETQEGLAVLAEHLCGGLTGRRLRQLAGRVVAVHDMVGGAEFPEVHRRLVDLGFGWGQAFTTTLRVFRSGGLTKDLVYLRGLRHLVDHLRDGGTLDALWLGKLSLAAAPLVQELHDRGALVDPVLTPHHLDGPLATERLEALRSIDSLTSLIGEPS